MRIDDLRREEDEVMLRVAEILVAGFAEHSIAAWPDLASALSEAQTAR